MVSAEMFEMIDVALRLARDVDSPYGGVLFVAVGDMYQARSVRSRIASGLRFPPR